VIKQLRRLERTDPTGHVIETKVPSDLSKTLSEIFQTSSDNKFNKIFEHLFLNGFQASIMQGKAGYGLFRVHPQASGKLLFCFERFGLRMDWRGPEDQ
jgi:hypothetical protein